MKEIKNCFLNYFNFSGKAERKEFIFFLLFRVATLIALAVLADYSDDIFDIDEEVFCAVVVIFWIGTLIPMAAVGVRRLHDLGRSGWWFLIVLIPIANLIFYFCLAVVRGETPERSSARGCFIAALICSFLPPFALLLIPLSLYLHDVCKEEFGKIKSRAMLRSMYRYLNDYQREHGAYPAVDPDNYSVRDLYPLFEKGKARPKRLKTLLQPIGRKYEEFSQDLTIDDFDPDHIGWSYNPKARPGSDDPLLGEHYDDILYHYEDLGLDVSSTVDFDLSCYHDNRGHKIKSHKPLMDKEGVTVLLANGHIVYIKKTASDNCPTNVIRNWNVLKK